ncbi:AMP-binding protein [Nocardioides aestuarii]|uniref:AMP-binding protein n=1 Tax=Nocardioides aestuarii TaxID=252231 RepID=A0ABW4TQ81_9ACTN
MTSLLHPVEVHPPRVLDLRAHGARTAVHTADGRLTYDELADRVDALAERLGDTRRLVLVEGSNTVESLAAYLAAVTAGHVALLTPPGRPARALVDAWDPDVVLGHAFEERRDGTAHDLHPDLALLLSTSGSTGSPKLVRLSHDNLRSNAASIATYLEITPADNAITSLPLHYCYGLSVVHSHLLVGATLVLTDLSVVDECFWRLAAEARATSFAGVPYTFEQLERSGFADRELPALRYVTQAGGRMAPNQVTRWRDHGRSAGWDLVVMYGQTEATARMAWLPPELAEARPDAVGVPVPGGSFRLEPVPEVDEPGVGELVYAGPNVMMGYAAARADLARGRDLVELRTGDLGRCRDGVWEVLGRRGRQAKLFGLRLDLDHLERELPVALGPAHCLVLDAGDGPALHAFTTRPRSAGPLATSLCEVSGLPASAVRVTTLAELPRTPSGKPCRAALAEHARLARQEAEPASVRDDYALVLGRPDATDDDSFVSLGGDSLSYVELATRLSTRLGDLPTDWHTRPIGTLAPTPSRRGTRVDTSVVLRALAIVAVVATHANVWTVVGGAHVLLVVAGWNLARFQLAASTRTERLRHGLASLAQLVVPASLWIAGVGLVTGTYTWHAVTYSNGVLGGEQWTPDWEFWFLEAIVWTTAAALALLAVPAVDRLERRAPYRFALGLTLGALAWRYWWVGLEAGPTNRYTIVLAAFFLLLGWTASRADTPARRWTVVALAAVATYGFFGDPWREGLIVAGTAALVLLPTVRLPRCLVAPVCLVASSSLFVYLTHWQVYPHLEDHYPVVATLASFAVGIGVWWLARPALRALGRLTARV